MHLKNNPSTFVTLFFHVVGGMVDVVKLPKSRQSENLYLTLLDRSQG